MIYVYVRCNGPIAGTLLLIAEYQKKVDYIMIPWLSYDNFKKHPSFISEVIVTENEVDFCELRFREDNRDWSILIKKSLHPRYLKHGESYGFIKSVTKNGKELSHSKISYERLQQYISEIKEKGD